MSARARDCVFWRACPPIGWRLTSVRRSQFLPAAHMPFMRSTYAHAGAKATQQKHTQQPKPVRPSRRYTQCHTDMRASIDHRITLYRSYHGCTLLAIRLGCCPPPVRTPPPLRTRLQRSAESSSRAGASTMRKTQSLCSVARARARVSTMYIYFRSMRERALARVEWFTRVPPKPIGTYGFWPRTHTHIHTHEYTWHMSNSSAQQQQQRG